MDKIVVLAAGASSRFWPLAINHHKTFYRLGIGKTILEETVEGLLKSKRGVEICLVIAPRDLDLAKELFEAQENIKIFVQKEPNGAGQALLLAIGKGFSGKFFLTGGDKINAGLILEKLEENDQAIAIRKTTEPKHFGIVDLNSSGFITSVVEKPGEGQAVSGNKITSAYLLDSSFLPFIEKFESNHYSLEEALNEFVLKNKIKGVFVDDIEDTRLKFPWDLLDVNKKVQKRKHTHLIHDTAEISKSAVIEGDVYIEKGAKISDFVKIVGPVYIGENSFIGDFSLVRENSFIDNNVIIGAHSEVKNSILYANTTIHRSYVGDSIIDSNSRIGGGVVLANKRYDRGDVKSAVREEKLSTGLRAFGAVVGFGANIGTNVTTMPGVKLGKNATVWPGCVVLEDVPDDQTLK